MKKNSQLLLIAIFAIANMVAATPSTTSDPVVFAMDAKILATTKAKIDQKDPALMQAYQQLIKEADEGLSFGPVSVMEKTNQPPSGDKHDYMSLAPYFWPDPSKPNGLPYMRKDGQTNPEVSQYKDKNYLPKLCEVVNTLSLANYFSADEKYALHAIKLVKVWFLDTATRMNPNLNYGQAIKGENNGRGAGLIDTRHFIALIDGIGMLHQSGVMKEEDFKGMQKWFAQFLNWMQTSKNGTDEMKTKNNHGVWYDAQRLSMALFTNQTELAKKVIENVKKRIDSQMDKDGFFPAELVRTNSLHYSLFVVKPLMIVAQMARVVNVDLYAYTSSNGNSIRKGIEALQPFLTKEKVWTGQQISPFNFKEGISVLAYSAAHFNCSVCKKAISEIQKSTAEDIKIQLTNNIDL